MKRFFPIFEKFQGSHLVIVDVQEPFRKWWEKLGMDDYVESLMEYAKQFNYVYQIWDSIDASKPDFEFPNEVKTIEKNYGGEPDWDELDDQLDLSEVERIKKDRKNEDFYDSDYLGNSYDLRTGGKLFYIGGDHDWFFTSDELVDLFEELSRVSGKIVLVGGADNECLTDVERAMEIMGVKFEVNHDYVYYAI